MRRYLFIELFEETKENARWCYQVTLSLWRPITQRILCCYPATCEAAGLIPSHPINQTTSSAATTHVDRKSPRRLLCSTYLAEWLSGWVALKYLDPTEVVPIRSYHPFSFSPSVSYSSRRRTYHPALVFLRHNHKELLSKDGTGGIPGGQRVFLDFNVRATHVKKAHLSESWLRGQMQRGFGVMGVGREWAFLTQNSRLF